jgi:hypothetical protein
MAPIGVIAMQVAASLSMLATTYVVITIVRMKLSSKLFLKLILFIAICDFGSAASVVVGGTHSESIECYIQGIANNYFCLASFLWTMVIGYEMHLLIWYSRVQTDLRIISVVNWTLPLILSLIPLSTSTYGNDDGAPGWCFFNSRDGYTRWVDGLWEFVSFYLWIFLMVLYLFYVSALSSYKLYYLQKGKVSEAHRIIERIIYFPIIVVVCWLVSALINIGSRMGLKLPIDANNAFTIIFKYVLPNLQGLWHSFVLVKTFHNLFKISLRVLYAQLAIIGEVILQRFQSFH